MPLDFTLERNSANDANATITAVIRRSGEWVNEGDHILDYETSKATEEVSANASGYLQHSLKEGDDVDFGKVLFRILDSNEESPVQAEVMADSAMVSADRCITDRAIALAAELRIPLSTFHQQFVTVHDVRREADLRRASAEPKQPPATEPSVAQPVAASEPPIGLTKHARHKRHETASLMGGAGNTALSVIGVDVGQIGQRIGTENPFFANGLLDLIVYEASRLVLKYPRLNAAFVDGDHYAIHPNVNAGVAFDEGQRLVVYSIRESDKLDLHEIQHAILNGLESYTANTLTTEDLTSSTFTVTDLSGTEAGFIFPLLPKNQSLIVAIGRDRQGYRLFAGFDHRVSEGREVNAFLVDLKDRLLAYLDANSEHECHFCGQGLRREIARGGRGFIPVRVANNQDALCCHSCWVGN